MLGLDTKPCEAVFISDLHLHPNEQSISARFNVFIKWAALNTKTVYILGDFFHAWAGDDEKDTWSFGIAERLKWLSEQNVTIYFMHGNRDFLLGQDFADSAGMTILPEPSLVKLGNNSILLVHGDRYCTEDIAHQRFRRITRSPWFTRFFLNLPLKFRKKLVQKVRRHSQTNQSKPKSQMDVVLKPMLAHMKEHDVTILIHGHTHKPALSNHRYNNKVYSQYVLSDWDDSPRVLCYYESKGFFFDHEIC
ncbi:MAG: UDP-2,3-diacylglucosamine diphosphatase [Tatlockia sp.]|nr:UDP-2,3-diacylglucosamine diphosphatase [Tatlockia sp.]